MFHSASGECLDENTYSLSSNYLIFAHLIPHVIDDLHVDLRLSRSEAGQKEVHNRLHSAVTEFLMISNGEKKDASNNCVGTM